jgi:hypothetical protein
MVSQEKRGGGTIAFQDDKLWAALSKTDLLVAPPGHTRVEAHALVKATHKVIHERLPKPVSAKPTAKKKVARKSAKKSAKKAVARKPAKKAEARKRATKSSKTTRR